MKLIDKDPVVAEFERRINNIIRTPEEEAELKQNFPDQYGVILGYRAALSILDKAQEFLQEEPVSEDLPHIRYRDTLDEFAYQCAYDLSNDWAKETPEWKDVKTACKLGAQWQKEQIMAKAIDGIVRPDDGEIWFDFKLHNFEDGDKVKVIVIKED